MPQIEPRREVRDEVRARATTALVAFLRQLRLLGALGTHLLRVDVEVRHQAGAERLDELDAPVERRELRPRGRGMDVLGPDADDDLASVGLRDAGVAREAHRRDGQRRRADRDRDPAAVRVHGPLEEVHRRRSDEARDEEVDGSS